jgi:hypothetical protein
MIEISRYKNLENEERLCKLCITQKIEDEYHFLIISIIRQINQNSIIYLPMKIFQ